MEIVDELAINTGNLEYWKICHYLVCDNESPFYYHSLSLEFTRTGPTVNKIQIWSADAFQN